MAEYTSFQPTYFIKVFTSQPSVLARLAKPRPVNGRCRVQATQRPLLSGSSAAAVPDCRCANLLRRHATSGRYSENRSITDLGSAHPCQVSFDRADVGQSWRFERRSRDLPISLSDREITGHTLTRHNLPMLGSQPNQFIAAKATPEPEQQQGSGL